MDYSLVTYVQDDQIRVRYADALKDDLLTLGGVPEGGEIVLPTSAALELQERFGHLKGWWRDAGFEGLFQYEFKTPPWRHQFDAFQFAVHREAAALFMGVGAGKTKVVCDIIANRRHYRTLVIAPNRLLAPAYEWQKAVTTHGPDWLRVVHVDSTLGPVWQRTDYIDAEDRREVPTMFVLNYEATWREPLKAWLLDRRWDLVVLDESHRVKSAGSKQSRMAHLLARRAGQRIILSGTPMPNKPLDIYGQYRFLDDTVFGTRWDAFAQRYAIWGGYEGREVIGYINQDEFKAKLDSLAFQVKSEDVLDLPDEQDIVIPFTLPAKLMRQYRQLEREFYTQIEQHEIAPKNVLAQLTKLQQVVNGFVKDEETETWVQVDTTKRKVLEDLLEDLPHRDENGTPDPLVVFAVFRHDLDNIKHATRASGRVYGELSGRRDDYVAWGNGELDVIGVQIQAGGEGLNAFVSARYCVFYGTGYDNGKYRQARGRVHRPGQNRSVVYFHIHGQGTIDEKIFNALQSKQGIIDTFIGGQMKSRSDIL